MSQSFTKSIKNSNYNLKVKTFDKKTQILFQMLVPIFTTSDLPHTLKTLEKLAPCVLHTQCFNANNLPFNQEVQQTEIAHLFEHLILALTQQQVKKTTNKNSSFEGVTEWDWNKYPKGSFKISMDIGMKDWDEFEVALNESMQILDDLLAQKSYRMLKQVD